ncbi:PA2169 family four-helix-bundle protein [Chitinolyticbacter meiyuanensis]|uniref:PA2169 family four-helix-bundle protein n=1 Tax=Chitinolyticbacter meiyuanensis TaxID=682798 RepID=UPI0011E5E233|nr:PA2169 family four-helix-bundle protein [Chitinolyticbacter meiyuanensis]
MDNSEVVSVLNNLIETSKDGEYGFNECVKYATATELKNLFRMRAAECRNAADELARLVRLHGGEAEEGGTVAGAVHRGWVTLRTAVTSNDDLAVLEECERGEDKAKASYAEALEKGLPVSVHELVNRQYQGVLSNHAEIKALRQRYRQLAA